MKSKAKSLALLVIVSLGFAAYAGSQPAPSLGGVDITGVWKLDGSSIFLQLNEDGTYAFAEINPTFLEKAPFEAGQFRLEGTLLTLIPSDDSHECKGQNGSYQVDLTGQDQLRFVLQEDACQLRANGHEGT
jgi:hypothetical protein